jgi:hypothetical protein
MSINDVPRFLAIFDLPTYLVLLYNVQFWGLLWTPLPTPISDVINGRSPIRIQIGKQLLGFRNMQEKLENACFASISNEGISTHKIPRYVKWRISN